MGKRFKWFDGSTTWALILVRSCWCVLHSLPFPHFAHDQHACRVVQTISITDKTDALVVVPVIGAQSHHGISDGVEDLRVEFQGKIWRNITRSAPAAISLLVIHISRVGGWGEFLCFFVT